jgi:hypothetical protein
MTNIVVGSLIGVLLLAGCNSSSNNNGEKGFNTSTYPKTENLSLEVKKSLAYMGNEERLAYDLYNQFFEEFPDAIQFKNIATKSEIKHIQAVQELVQRYEIIGTELSDSNFTTLNYQNTNIEQMQPGVYGVLSVQQLYNTLYAEGISDKISALKIGCKVEVVDIEDLNKYLIEARNIEATDVISTFEFLQKGSYKHYWSFDEALKNLNITNGCNLGVEPFGDKTNIYPR